MNALDSPGHALGNVAPPLRETRAVPVVAVPRISVVVTTRANPASLRCCIAALLDQRIEPGAYEIVVVDDGHADETRLMVEAMAPASGVPALRYFRPRVGNGPAVARNVGWREAYGDLIAFTDDEAIPAHDWLACGEAALASDLVAVAGPVRVAGDAARAQEPASFPTGNVFVRRTALQRIGGIDEHFERPSGDDPDLKLRLESDAGPVGCCNEAVVLRPGLPGCLKRQRDAYFDALLYKKHPLFFREGRRDVPPWEHYLIVCLSLAVPLFLLLGIPGSAVVSVLLATGLVLKLAVRRLRQSATTESPRSSFLGTLATSALIPFLSVYWRVCGALRFRVWFF